MAELKTKKNKKSVDAFLKGIPEKQQTDCFALLGIFESVTKEKAAMWGESIIGFGEYHYKSERSSQEGNWFLAGFSPRKRQISLYLMSGFKEHEDLLKTLGKHKVSSGCCLYIQSLEDIHIPTLKKLIRQSVKEVKKRYAND